MPRCTIIPTALLLCAGLCLYGLPAQAQTDSEGESNYYLFRAEGWGLDVSLALHGTLSQPGDPEWARPDLDWLWLSDAQDLSTYPVYQVDGATVGRGEEFPDGLVMTSDDFENFYNEMLSSLSEDTRLTVVETDPGFETSDKRRWVMFLIEEHQDNGSPDDESDDIWLNYYSFFTLDPDVLRLVNVYFAPLSEEEDFITALEAFLTIDTGFEGDSYDQ